MGVRHAAEVTLAEPAERLAEAYRRHGGAVVAVDQYEFTQHFPNPGWVEHDADEIWESQLRAARGVMEKASVSATEITVIRFSGVPGELVRPSVLLLSRVEMNSIVSR